MKAYAICLSMRTYQGMSWYSRTSRYDWSERTIPHITVSDIYTKRVPSRSRVSMLVETWWLVFLSFMGKFATTIWLAKAETSKLWSLIGCWSWCNLLVRCHRLSKFVNWCGKWWTIYSIYHLVDSALSYLNELPSWKRKEWVGRKYNWQWYLLDFKKLVPLFLNHSPQREHLKKK